MSENEMLPGKIFEDLPSADKLAMSFEEYTRHDGLGLAELVRKGEVTPTELAEIAAAGIGKVNPQLNAIVAYHPDRVAEVDAETDLNGPFAGVPTLLKDMAMPDKDKLLTDGSRMAQDYVPEESGHLVKMMKQQCGFNIIATTTAPEFGTSLSTESTLHGKTHNPYKLGYSSGGSSGGTGAAVAAGIVPVAQAGDGGGSARVPAAACGLYGFKTSRGFQSLGPEMNDGLALVISEAMFNGHSVRDLAAGLDGTKGQLPGEFVPSKDYPSLLHTVTEGFSPRKFRIAVRVGDARNGQFPIDPEMQNYVLRAAEMLVELGHDVEEIGSMPYDEEAYYKAMTDCFIIGTSTHPKGMSARSGRPMTDDWIEPVHVKMVEESLRKTADDALGYYATFNQTARAMGRLHEQYDVLLTPFFSHFTPELGIYDLGRKDLGVYEYMDLVWGAIPYSPVANATGQPACIIPLFMKDGLPVAVQAYAKIGDDATLFNLMRQVEEAYPFKHRPAVHVTN
ncbi:hypothetical protein HBA55_02260 [Pseudomaricurvus alkylphenolicus]|uniref:amidase n=1 Tax=Pseudomaricurvus alkylphenolicus TaxID=1306991 RepID=UPI001421663B|nr:amidase family protein [Pseudomaricurvus alkylphenolicus]NIB38387.1 hypothetical protein [Pseudomaricurvus alkylphenolicus]